MLGFFVVKLKNRIVRLFIMTKITRRSFLKGAGVAALAVAAAGVMTGCSKDEIEEIVTKDVKVLFMCDGATVPGDQKTLKVALDATTVNINEIPTSYFPFGYQVTSTGDLTIKNIGGADCILVMVKDIIVEIEAHFYEGENEIKIAYFDCAASATTITKAKAEELAGDWCTVVGDGPFTIDWSKNIVRIEATRNNAQ